MGGMKSVLIVDDEKPFLESVKLGFSTYESDFKLYTAENGKAAVEVLKSEIIDIVVTDVKMPEMDGFELLAYISKHYPAIPVIVMSAYADTEMKKKFMSMGTLGLLEKPLDFDDLAAMVKKWLQMTSKSDSLKGISLESFLQLVELEQKTYLLKIIPRDKENTSGLLYTFNGEIYDAVCGELKGEEAVFEILGWENPEIIVKKTPSQKFARRIERSIMSILLEASTRRDESEEQVKGGEALDDGEETQNGNFEDETMDNEMSETIVLTETVNKEERKMALESYLEELKSIKGYKASAIMTFTGEVLASDTVDAAVQLEYMGAIFNDIFRGAHEACEKAGLDAAKELIFITPKGLVVMLCSGTKAKVHFHTIVILASDGNQALAKMTLEKIAPKIMEEL